MTIPVDEILEDLEVSRAAPGPGFLERLFLRFNDRVPFETASKIRRHARIADPAEKPRRPEIFWQEHLEWGAGGTCFARVAAFDALIQELGFRTRRALGRVRSDFDHAALFVTVGDAEWICDAGFPLPALLPASPSRVETPLGAFEIARTDRGFRVDFDGGVPDGPRRLEIFEAPVAPGEYDARWQATFRSDSKFLSEVVLHRLLGNRRIVFARGTMRIDDLHSRTRVPLAPPRSPALETAFGVEAAFLEEAFALAGDAEPESPDASVEVFLESPVSPAAAFAAIATPSGYAAPRPDSRAWRPTSRARIPSASGSRPAASAPIRRPPSLEESVRIDAPAKTLAVVGKGANPPGPPRSGRDFLARARGEARRPTARPAAKRFAARPALRLSGARPARVVAPPRVGERL